MKALVAVKRVVDHNVRVRIKADGSGVDTAGVKMSINPFDEIAVEEALRLKERGLVSEIVAVTLGEATSQDVLRHALAMGVDRVILVETATELQPLGVAKLLKAVAEREAPQLVLLGKQAIDDDAGQVGQMLAALLGTAQGTFASKIDIENGEAIVVREVEGGTETVALKLPAVITADLRLAEPRFVKLPNLMMAKKKPIETLAADSLGVDFAPRVARTAAAEPPVRAAGIKVGSVAELVQKLREAKVI
ncbi:electron transfer flavoprotein subunit beta/FixA family protein [Chitinolyticbacter meiyuanensis]|uniref:electron transfer flavoprotein subunit beta/FixA family protein n=1 Tax=Chitinolyticbacter meiyuanensis TaxID=682798 RepID=UPI0011E5D9E1|nr:electron transfer flavoprotein subunit beta/FixA family protein [Chitinolyticbacter meiyuanensis]